MSSWPRNRNCKIRSNVWMIQENVRMPNQCAVDKYPTFPANLRYFLFQLVSRARNPQPESWNTHGFSGNVFANSPAYSSTLCFKMLNSWDVHATGKIQMKASTRQPAAGSGARDKDTIPTPRFLRSPSARNPFNPMEGQLLRIMELTNKRLQISELHFHKFPTPQTFSFWKTRFKTEVCSCSNFLEEMVNSVDDLKSSCSIQRVTPFPDFFVLDAGIASALNKIIQKYCKKKVSLEEQRFKKKTDSFEEDRSPTWSTITFGSLASTIPYLFMPTYLRLFFGMTTFRSSIRDGMKFYC